jgi:hypothetical protein
VGYRYVVCSSMIEFLIPSEVDHIGNWSKVVRKFEAMIYFNIHLFCTSFVPPFKGKQSLKIVLYTVFEGK